MESGKTIKQIADELGVSKTSVYKKIDNLGLRSSLRKSQTKFTVDETQETLIKSAFSKNEPQTKTANQVCDIDNQVYGVLKTTIDTLQRELEIKNKQIEELNARLSESNAALVSAQQTAQSAQALHAGTIQQQLIGTDEQTKLQETSEKQGIFRRLFGNKNK